jgi:molybdopterin converting factor small subunit
MRIQVFFTGRSFSAATPLSPAIELPDGSGVDAAIQAIRQQLPQGEQLAPSCLVAVSGEHIGSVKDHLNRQLRDGDELVLIAPVAGG